MVNELRLCGVLFVSVHDENRPIQFRALFGLFS